MRLKTGTTEEVERVILNKDLVGSSIKMNIFSMRTSKSRIVSTSMLTKKVITLWRQHLHEERSIYAATLP